MTIVEPMVGQTSGLPVPVCFADRFASATEKRVNK